MRIPYAPLLAILTLCTLVGGASALPFLPIRPGHLPAPPKVAEARQAGYGVAENCYLVEVPGTPAGEKPALVEECD